MNDSVRRDRPTAAPTPAPDAIGALLRGTWLDPDDNSPIRVPVLAVAIERTLVGMEAELLRQLPTGRRLAVVGDANTFRVAGARIAHALASIGAVVQVVLDGTPHADLQTVERLRAACTSADALVAVGSGTINDLCKYAAATEGKPYVVFATAPSMNGYTSMNAAITVDGHKKSLAAAAPLGVFVDLAVFAAAPRRLIRAGLGDSLCRTTAQVDWRLSHHLFGTPYRSAPFALLAADEPVLLDAPEAIIGGDLDAMAALARTLLLSGFGMTICGGSYPASQGEHLISHCIDMFAPAGRPAYFHGEQVGVATLTMARIQQAMLDGSAPRVAAATITRDALRGRFGPGIGDSCWTEYEIKRLSGVAAALLSARIEARWDAIVADLTRMLVPIATLADAMTRAGCPRTPGSIGVTPDDYARAVRDARFLRDRYTFLDLTDDAGRLCAFA